MGWLYVHTQRVSFPPRWVGLGPSVPSHQALFLSEALTLLSDSCLAPMGTALYFSLHPFAKVINPEVHGSNHNIWVFTKVARLADHMTLADLFPKICLQVYGEINESHVLSTILNKNDTKTSRKQQRKGGQEWGRSHEDYSQYNRLFLDGSLSTPFLYMHNTFTWFILFIFSTIYYYSSWSAISFYFLQSGETWQKQTTAKSPTSVYTATNIRWRNLSFGAKFSLREM